MATIYVDSAAGGANNGTSWTDAYTSLGSTTGAAAGDTILVDDGHSQSVGSTTTWTWSNGTGTNPVKILSADKADDSLSPGAVVGAASGFDLTLNGSIYVHGLTINSGRTVFLAANAASYEQTYEECTLGITSGVSASFRQFFLGPTGAITGSRIRLLNCTLDTDTGGSSNTEFEVQGGIIDVIGGSCRVNSASASIFTSPASTPRPVWLTVTGVDLSASGETTLWTWGGGALSVVRFERCRLPSGYTAASGTPGVGSSLTIERCAAGSISLSPLGVTYATSPAGTVQSSLSRYRTGGADDGLQANAHSWEMATSSAAQEVYGPLASPQLLMVATGGSSVTFTFFVASATTLNDDDFWVELAGPDDSSPTYTEGYVASTRMAPLGTPTALTTDGDSTWNGTGVGTQQKVSITYTPQVTGPVTARFYLAKPSTTVYVDPTIEVS